MFNSFILITLQILAVLLVQTAIYRRFLHPLSHYPGPFLASVTNLWKFYHFLAGHLYIVESNLHAYYGPIVRTGPNSLSFSKPDAFESIYGFNHSFEKGSFYEFAREGGSSNIFSSRTHAEHRDRRRAIVGAALTTSNVRSYGDVIEKHTQHFLSKLEGEDDVVLNIAESVHELTFNIMAELIYGPSLSIDGKPWTETVSGEGVLTAFRAASKFSWGMSHVPFLGWLMSTAYMRKLTRKPMFNKSGIPIGIGPLIQRASYLVLENSEALTSVDQPSIAKNMLEKGVPKEHVFKECLNLLFAGPGSTAAAVTNTFERLGSPDGIEWQPMIRDHDGEGNVLDAVIKESLRYSAPFPNAFPRDVCPGAENTIAGLQHPIPVGTLVGANTWVVSHDEQAWGGDAGLWRPERWLENEDSRLRDEKLLVFSKGPRACVGKEIALMVLHKAVAGVVKRWQIETVGNMKQNGWLEMQIEWLRLKLTKV